MDEILQELIASMKKDFPRKVPTNENLYEYYLNRCRQNLHVVLCFSPVSIALVTKNVYLECLLMSMMISFLVV